MEGDYNMDKEDSIINNDNLQENYFNVNNDAIAEVNKEVEEDDEDDDEDDEPINNEDEGVGNVNHAVHIENYNDEDLMLEGPLINV